MIRCRSKNIHQYDVCLKEIGLHASNFVNHLRFETQPGWGVGDSYDFLLRKRIFTVIMDNLFI